MAGFVAAIGGGMLTPTGWFLATVPIDLRCGADRLLVSVQSLVGHDAFAGGAYVFRNRSATRIKVLLADATGVWLCTRRLQSGRFVWPRAGEVLCALSATQFSWLCAGVDWQRLSASHLPAKWV
jgi:transposase